jgi:exosortase
MSWRSLGALLRLSLQDERYTYCLVVPIISVALLYADKEQIFHDFEYSPAAGVPVVLLGLMVFFVGRNYLPNSASVISTVGALLLLWLGAFSLCYGVRSFRKASFPLLLLLLIVPIPGFIFDRVVAGLRAGSAELSYGIFRLAGVPVLRHGMIMSLPGVEIEVAPECSGIRSTMALFVAGIVLSRVLLRSGWTRTLAIVCIGPIGILRNAVRIVCISLLGVYVDRGFFYGSLHRKGGLLFSLVGFVVLIPLLWLMRGWEHHLACGRIGVEQSARASRMDRVPK